MAVGLHLTAREVAYRLRVSIVKERSATSLRGKTTVIDRECLFGRRAGGWYSEQSSLLPGDSRRVLVAEDEAFARAASKPHIRHVLIPRSGFKVAS